MPSPYAPRLMPFFRRLCADKGGNILMLTGFSILLLTFAVGFGIDYSRAQRLQTKLNAAADAAALAAVDPSMLSQAKTMATAAGQQMFDQQVAGIPGLTNVVRTVTVTDAASGSLGTLRTATVTYTANSTNSFAGILMMPTLPIGGNATASASQPPSMNFYIALDTSPSMLLPTTSTGIANLKAGAIWSGEVYWYKRTDGCDFACHSNNMHRWNAGTYVIDNSLYPIYLNNGSNSATLPFYRVSCATGSDTGTLYDNNSTKLGTYAKIVSPSTNSKGVVSYNPVPTYCNTTSTFNQLSSSNPSPNPVYVYYLPNGKSNQTANYTTLSVNFPDTYWLAQNFGQVNPGASAITLRTDAESAAAGGVITYGYNVEQQYATANVPPIYKMQFFTFNVGIPVALNNAFGTMTDVKSLQSLTFDMGPYPLVADPTVSNPLTDFNAMLKGMTSILPTSAGAGTQASPQNVLIIITDGAADNTTDNDSSGQSTYFTATNVAQCNAIKAAGTRIAILYTQYLPETINYTGKTSFNTFASASVPKIQAQLQACASQNADGSYLMQTVSTDGSVSTALNTLFAMSVQTARLVQ
jgi:Flp pilus assembly protein TadG